MSAHRPWSVGHVNQMSILHVNGGIQGPAFQQSHTEAVFHSQRSSLLPRLDFLDHQQIWHDS